jgi:hypothetical protein
MKVIKKRFFSIRDKVEKILGSLLLTNKSHMGDVLELTSILKFIYDTSDLFLKTKNKDRPPISNEGATLDLVISGLETKISSIISSGKFSRVFGTRGMFSGTVIDQDSIGDSMVTL